jgi:hypothetical protein
MKDPGLSFLDNTRKSSAHASAISTSDLKEFEVSLKSSFVAQHSRSTITNSCWSNHKKRSYFNREESNLKDRYNNLNKKLLWASLA